MPNIEAFAFDRSARRIDADGRLHVEASRISKANVCPYYGKEIPGYQSLGLQPDRIYRLYRDPVELERGAPSFARLPILSKHKVVSADDPEKEIIAGTIGSNVEFKSPYLVADLCIWDAKDIAGIETDTVRELSCSYRYTPVMEAGATSDGEEYDGRMTEIIGNHLALVAVGRAGSDVVVADSNPFIFEDTEMKKREQIREKLMALDASIDSEKLDAIIDLVAGEADTPVEPAENNPEPVEPPKVAEDSPAKQVEALLAGKVDPEVIAQVVALFAPAADDEAEEDDKGEELKAAMDSFRAELRAADAARRDVRAVVGDVNLEKAEEIYAFALDHLSIEHKDVKELSGLRALFKVASAPKAPVKLAHDSGKTAERFPALNRFK